MGTANDPTHVPPQPTTPTLSGRRAFLGRAVGLTAGLVGGAAAAALTVGTAPASAADGNRVLADQSNWRFCQSCFAMFYYGYPTNGRCPATGAGHTMQGFNFILPFNVAETPTAQHNWRFCQSCYVMFYYGYPTNGRCPATGAGHTMQGYDFVLPHDIPETPTRQRNWRFCDKCYAMYFWGYPTDGVCPAGGAHHAQGYNFALPHQ